MSVINELAGGALRVSTPTTQPQPKASTRLHNLGEVTERGPSSYNAGAHAPVSSVLATRRTVNGADTVQLIPGNEGTRTHIAQAVRDGLLIQTGPGLYANAGGQR